MKGLFSLTDEQKTERFTYGNCLRCGKGCAFHWEEHDDYSNEWDCGCYFGGFRPEFQPNTLLVCWLPKFIQKIILKKLEQKDIDDFVEWCEETSKDEMQ